ncbi:hypothetical protein F4604DRAFT_1506592, partial [Suillus subluteus]
ENRAPWAHIAQAILAKHTQKAPIVHPAAREDPFLQTWKPAITKLPAHLKRILKVARKYNLQWETIANNPEVTRLLPIWFHLGANEQLNKLNNSYYAECLQERHKVCTFKEMEMVSIRSSPLHHQNRDCKCAHCELDRSNLGCQKPYKCRKLVKDILKCIKPKWDP